MPTNRIVARAGRVCGIAALLFALAIPIGNLAAQDEGGTDSGATTTVSDADVTVNLTPTEAKLDAGVTTQTLVLTAEASGGTFEKATLATFPGPGISANVVGSPGLSAIGNSARGNLVAWTIEVTADGKAPSNSTVVFRIDYELTGEIAGTVAASIPVAYQPLSLNAVIDASLKKGFGELETSKAYKAILDIKNSGPVDVQLTAVELSAPDAIRLEVSKLPVTIPANGMAAVPLDLTMPERVVPGDLTLLLSLALSHGPVSATLLLTDQVTVGIPVLSDITTALQIPSLLFLPGLLIVLTATMLWSLRSDGKLTLTPTNPEFYVVAVTLSIVAAWLFSWFAGEPFDFLRRVGVTDIARLWFGSIVAGIIGFGATVLMSKGLAALKTRREKEARRQMELITPETNDEAREIIAKLGRHGLGLNLDSRQITERGNSQVVFALGFGEAEAGKAWFVPKIQIFTSGETSVNEAIDDLRGKEAKGLSDYIE